MTRDLEGKTAFVTGGARGIGRGIAERLAASGAVVGFNYASNTKGADDTVAAIEAAGGRAFAIKAPIGTFDDIEVFTALAKKIAAELARLKAGPGVDILVNNIGGGPYGTIATATTQELDHTYANNIRTPFFVTQALLDQLNDNGRVINISSAASRLAGENFIAYSICKSGVDMLTRVLAKTLGPRGITVNSVAPGFTANETNEDVLSNPEMVKAVIADTALRRFGQVDEIADFVHALAAPASRWITAQNIEASGGFKL